MTRRVYSGLAQVGRRLRVSEGLLREAFAQFLRCGRGRDECVVYWTGSLASPPHRER